MSTEHKPLIAVVGATSKQGRSVASTLLKSNQYRVRALTRNRDSAEARSLAELGAEVVIAPLGLGHQKELVAAFQGADGAYLMTPQLTPEENAELALGKQLADAAVEAGVGHIVFSTLENVDKITNATKFVPHFTDKALVADYIRSLPVAHSFVSLAFFYTNLLEYYVPQMENGVLLMPIYLPEDFRAPFVDPVTATGPAVLSIFSQPETFKGKTLPIVGDIISPREMVETFQRVTGIKTEYRSGFKREELLRYFPAFGANDLLVQEGPSREFGGLCRMLGEEKRKAQVLGRALRRQASETVRRAMVAHCRRSSPVVCASCGSSRSHPGSLALTPST